MSYSPRRRNIFLSKACPEYTIFKAFCFRVGMKADIDSHTGEIMVISEESFMQRQYIGMFIIFGESPKRYYLCKPKDKFYSVLNKLDFKKIKEFNLRNESDYRFLKTLVRLQGNPSL